MTIEVIVADRLVPGVEAIIGMDVICRLGGVTITKDGAVQFATNRWAATSNPGVTTLEERESTRHEIRDQDFTAEFADGRWTVEWKWLTGPPLLKNKVSLYKLKEVEKAAFNEEVERWIEEGILIPWKDDVTEGLLPLMAVVQPTKQKVRPILDYRELNEHVSCHSGV